MNNFTRPNNISGGFNSSGLDEVTKETIRNMFDENGELIVYDTNGNPVKEDVAPVAEVTEIKVIRGDKSIIDEAKEIILNVEYKRANNERIIPNGDELKDKEFSDSMFCYLQSVSNYNPLTKKRYISSKYLSPTRLMEEVKVMKKSNTENGYDSKCISRDTATKNLKYLKANGYISTTPVDGSEVMEGLKGEYFELKNEFKYYSPLENEFIKALTSGLTQEALRVYLVYYGFNNTNDERTGTCILDQEEVMKRVGFAKSGKNYEKLRSINDFLRGAGLIVQEYLITRDNNNVEIKRNLVTKAPLYWECEFYKRMKLRLEAKPIQISENTYVEAITDFDKAFRTRGRKKKSA